MQHNYPAIIFLYTDAQLFNIMNPKQFPLVCRMGILPLH